MVSGSCGVCSAGRVIRTAPTARSIGKFATNCSTG